MPQDAEWRILAEEAAQENNPKKLIEIIEALTRALDQQQPQEKRRSAHLTVTLNIPRLARRFQRS